METITAVIENRTPMQSDFSEMGINRSNISFRILINKEQNKQDKQHIIEQVAQMFEGFLDRHVTSYPNDDKGRDYLLDIVNNLLIACILKDPELIKENEISEEAISQWTHLCNRKLSF